MIFSTFDTETTGLPFHPKAELSKQPRIIEFAGVITDGIEIIDSLEFICNPGIAIEPIITQITGLTNEDLEDRPDISFFIPQIAAFFKQSDACIAHNLSFDKQMIMYDLMRRYPDVDIRELLEIVNWPSLEICTVEQTMPRYGRRMKLIELYEMHVGPYEQKHRALDDVMVLHGMAKAVGVYEAFKESRA